MENDEGTLAPEEQHERWRAAQEDGRGSLAVAAGLVAAVAGGLIWAAIVILANLEIGWAAWGVGALVGAAMGRVTASRSRGLGLVAAGLAAAGLLLGKVLILFGSTGSIAEEIARDREYMEGAVAWQLYEARELDPLTLDSLDAWQQGGDTLSDALWAQMKSEAAVRVADMTEAERLAVARATAQGMVQRMGVAGGVAAQLSGWDLLWFGLAVVTAYGMLARGGVPAAEPEPART